MFNSLLNQLKNDYPELVFKSGRKFLYHPPRTILFKENIEGAEQQLLHELGHAILKHVDFRTDIERLKMERKAWDKAIELAKTYHININQDMIEEELDSYRNWLHQKSLCKKCGLTRYQTLDGVYHCPHCDQ